MDETPEARECPGCGTLAYMGDNPKECAACFQERKARVTNPSKPERLFNAEQTIPGQMNF